MIWKNRFTCAAVLLLVLTMGATVPASAQEFGGAAVKDIEKILPEKERAEIYNEWLRWRLDNLIPMLMKREGIDLWLIINREYNEDPVYMSMMPEPTMNARRTSILMFHDRGGGPRSGEAFRQLLRNEELV